MSLQKAKKADPIFINAVFGFVREHEKNSSTNVPVIIKYLILNFYSLIDKFAEHDGTAQLMRGNTFALKPLQADPSYTIIIGDVEVGQMNDGEAEYEWTLKIQSYEDIFAVGLMSVSIQKFASRYDRTGPHWRGFDRNDPPMYGFYKHEGYIAILREEEELYCLSPDSTHPEIEEKGDVKLRFNVKKMELELWLKVDEYQKIQRLCIPMGTYRLFVGLFDNLDTASAKLLKFTIKNE